MVDPAYPRIVTALAFLSENHLKDLDESNQVKILTTTSALIVFDLLCQRTVCNYAR